MKTRTVVSTVACVVDTRQWGEGMSPEYMYVRMLYWAEQAEVFRTRYNNQHEKVREGQGADAAWVWQRSQIAGEIIGNQQSAVAEATMWASVLTASILWKGSNEAH
jgi:hypothetical protein